MVYNALRLRKDIYDMGSFYLVHGHLRKHRVGPRAQDETCP